MNYNEPPSKMRSMAARKARRLSPRLLVVGAVALAVAGLLVYRIASPGAGRNGREQIAPPVRVAPTETRDVPIIAHTIGTVLANATVAVKSQIDGQLLSVHFQEGQLVKKGDVLFNIDPRPAQADVRRAEAQVARDKAQLASAQSDADRASALAQRGIVSTQQRDQMIADAKALSATEAADEAALEQAKLNLSYTTIRAPMDGKTGPYLVHPGNLVKANDANGLVVINQIRPVKITFSLPQDDLPQLQARMATDSLIASLHTHSDLAVPGPANDEADTVVKVDFIGNQVDDSTGTIELRATFPNPDRRLVPGELVDVQVQLNTLRDATVVPRDAVNIGQDGGNYVFVVKPNDTVEMRPVHVEYQDDTIAALQTGVLKSGERVVTDGQLRLTPGVKVDILNGNKAAMPAAGQNAGGADQVNGTVP